MRSNANHSEANHPEANHPEANHSNANHNASRRVRAVMRVLAALAALTLTSLSATAHAQACAPPAADCLTSAATFDGQTQQVARDAREPVAFVASYRLAACHARRACLITDAELHRVEAWSDAELQALTALPDEAARATWWSGLGSRVPELRTPPPATASPLLAAPPPGILEHMVRLRDELEMLDRFLPLIDEVARTARPRRDGSAPAACRGDVRERLQAVVRDGVLNSASHARDIREKLDDVCDRFARWEQPTEAVEGRIRRVVTQVERAQGYLNDVIRCHEPGPYDGRCRNTFGPPTPDAVAQARAALREIAAVQRAIRGVPERPFPCREPLWERLVATRWTLRVAEAQIPSLGRAALETCESIGVRPSDLAAAHRELDEALERVRAQVEHTRRNTEATLQQLRRHHGLH